ncbi:MAG: GNAT family N-acetyltransferase [Gaiellaceae bacterium]
MRFEAVAYEPWQRDALRGLMREVWGASAPAEEFDWWFERNPAGRRLISLVVDGERIAGASAMSFFRMRLDGREHEVPFALDAAMHPDYRGQGLWSLLELHNEEESARDGAPAVLGFPNPISRAILVGKLGWRDLARLRLWARPLAGHGGRGRGVEPFERFGPDAEALYAEARRVWGNHLVRSADFLNWRYADSPRPYRRFAARRDGRLEGYAVLGQKEYAGWNVGVVADLVGSPRAVRALLGRCAREARGVRALVALVSPAQRRAFLASGFAPTHKSIRFIGKPLQPGVDLPAERRAWHFTLGDMDIF